MGRKRQTLLRAAFGQAELGGPGCWEWFGAKNEYGYGQSHHNNRSDHAHRLAYEALVGPIPAGMQIDHVRARGCESRACVRPSHLEAVTPQINLLRGENHAAQFARRTHCDKGHEFDSFYMNRGRKVRRCSVCWKALNLAYNQCRITEKVAN